MATSVARPAPVPQAPVMGLPDADEDLTVIALQREELQQALDFALAQQLASEWAADEEGAQSLTSEVEVLKMQLDELAMRESGIKSKADRSQR